MTYSEAIQFLYDLRWFGTKFGLTNTLKLAALAGNLETAVDNPDLHVVAAKTRQLRCDHILIGGFVDVDRRNPPRRGGLEAVPLLDGQQIPDRIPPSKRHDRKSSIAIRYASG